MSVTTDGRDHPTAGAAERTRLRLSSATAMMGYVPVPHHSQTPLVGRDAELRRLSELTGLERPDQAGVVLLAGDAGVGKTRVLHELTGRAEAGGWRTLTGHCLDFGDSALPYLPFTEVVGRLAQGSPELVVGLTERHAALQHLLPGRRLLTGAGGADAESVDRAELFDALHLALEELADAAPLLLVLEDLHWADRSTRDLLTFLFMRGFDGPVSLVASYRSDDMHRRHPLRASLAQWSRTALVQRMQLPPLSDRAVRSLVRSLQTGPIPERELHTIVERAEGNAFFAEELVAAELGGSTLPRDLAGLLLLRLDQLDEAARQVVRAASCAGRQVSHDLLAAVVDLDETALERAVRAAVDTNVFVPVGTSYAFRHALLAEAVHDDLLPGERVRLHAAYVAALVSHAVEGTAAELARHARAAHDVPTAITASIDAGDDAMAVGGPDDAARHYGLALELLGDPARAAVAHPSVDVVSLAVRASDALLAAGDLPRALQLVQDQLARLPADAPSTDRARLLLTLATAALMGDTTVNALQATTEALALAGAGPSALRAKAMSVHARANADRQRPDEAMRWAVEAVLLGERLGLRRVVADATTTMARLGERAGRPEESRQTLEKIVAQARADGDVVTELRALHHLGALLYEAGQLVDAAEVYDAASARSVEIGRPWAPYGFDTRVMLAITTYVAGRWDETLRITDMTGEAPPEIAEAALSAVALGVAAGRGDTEALERFRAVRAVWEKDGFVAVLSGAAAIDLHGDAGDLPAAVDVHDAVVDSVRRVWQVDTFMAQVRLNALLLGQMARHVVSVAAEDRRALVRRGDDLLAEARLAEQHATSRGRRIGPEGVAWQERATAEHLRLRWLAGVDSPPPEELLDGWRRTVSAFAAFGHELELARSRARLAVVLRSLGRADDARAESDLARTAAERMGARPLLTELRVSGAPRPRREVVARDATLTPRELEILVLVAQGRTNSEIARQLFISAKTVSVHVSNILAKLGASGRTEAAALARTRGLLPA